MPDIGDVEARFSYQPNSTLIYSLCRVLVERGFADGELWKQAGSQPLLFARTAIQRLLERVWDGSLDQSVNYSFEVRDDGAEEGHAPPGRGRLYAVVDTQMSGYLPIGAVLDRLEQECAGLGAAFYRLLQRSLGRWIRVYDYTDARYYEENLREMLENDDPENEEAYEFPRIEEAIPKCLRDEHERELPACRRLLRQFNKGECGAWIEKLLRIHRLSRLSVRQERVHDEYDDPPLPALLIVFQEHDGVEAAFDAEAQYFYETSHEPAFAVPFNLNSSEECDSTLRSIAVFFRLNAELFQLVEALRGWEEAHASRHQHREES